MPSIDISSPPVYTNANVKSESAESTGDGRPKRETWSRKIDFLLACIGFSVGLGNVWRFPYLCYKNGGGAFLIPYFLFVLIAGVPLFFLEVSVGQFMSLGGIKAWTICPILQGIGWATTVTVFFLNCYYNVILTWSFYYLFSSFTTRLPWDSCDNYWNTVNCSTFSAAHRAANSTDSSRWIDSTTEFWERKVLGISNSLTEVGTIKWDLALCLLFAWLVILICIWNGIKTSGKVMYFTATSPYILMTILLIRGCMLPGALNGITYYLKPNLSKLLHMQVWVDAGTQIFFSSSIGFGALTALGSYNQFKHDSYRDSLIFAATNSATSIYSGFIIFSVLGFMAHEQGISDVGLVAESGPGLAFIAYPKAVSQMPGAPLWSGVFFFMLILLGLDSQFVGVEGFITACVDTFPYLQKTTRRRHLFLICTCLVKFIIGLSMVTNGGMYVFQLMDYYSGSRILLLIACFECIAIAWIYGINRFYDNVQMMLGYRPSRYMWICWTVLSPCFCMTIFLMSIVEYSELDYKRPTGTYVYPDWAVGVGWSLAASSAVCIPAVAVYNTVSTRMRGKPWKTVLKPKGLKPHQLRPEDIKHQTMDGLDNSVYEQKSMFTAL